MTRGNLSLAIPVVALLMLAIGVVNEPQNAYAGFEEPEDNTIWCNTYGDIERPGNFWTEGTCEIFVDALDIDEEFDVEIHGDLDLFGEGRCRDASTELTIHIDDNGLEGTIDIVSEGESCRDGETRKVNGEHEFTITGSTGDFSFITGGSGELSTSMDRSRNFDLDIHGTLEVEANPHGQVVEVHCEVQYEWEMFLVFGERSGYGECVYIFEDGFEQEEEVHIGGEFRVGSAEETEPEFVKLEITDLEEFYNERERCKGFTFIDFLYTGPDGVTIEVKHRGETILTFEDVDSGDTVTVIPEEGRDKLRKNTVIKIYDEETLLADFRIHTSCSQELEVGDIFEEELETEIITTRTITGGFHIEDYDENALWLDEEGTIIYPCSRDTEPEEEEIPYCLDTDVTVEEGNGLFSFLTGEGTRTADGYIEHLGIFSNGYAYSTIWIFFDVEEGETEPEEETKKNGGGCSNCQQPSIGVTEKGKRVVDGGITINGNTIDADFYHTPYPLIQAQIGTPVDFVFKIWDDRENNIKHVQVQLGKNKVGESFNKVGSVTWDRDVMTKIATVTHDPMFKNVHMERHIDQDCKVGGTPCTVVHARFTPTVAIVGDVVFGVNIWDDGKNTVTSFFNDGIQIGTQADVIIVDNSIPTVVKKQLRTDDGWGNIDKRYSDAFQMKYDWHTANMQQLVDELGY